MMSALESTDRPSPLSEARLAKWRSLELSLACSVAKLVAVADGFRMPFTVGGAACDNFVSDGAATKEILALRFAYGLGEGGYMYILCPSKA